MKFFTVLKYFLSFMIFQQLKLVLKTEFALNFSSLEGGPPSPASYATGHCGQSLLKTAKFRQFGRKNSGIPTLV